MSAASGDGSRHPVRAARAGFFLLWVAAAAWSGARLASDAAAWNRVGDYAASTALKRTSPADAPSVFLETSPDLAGAAAAALDRRGRPSGAVAEARAMLLGAVAARPGWPMFRADLAALEPGTERARVLLLLAARGAPGATRIQTALARADLAAWPGLPAAARREAEAAFRAACRDAAFVAADFSALVGAVGTEAAIGLLPERSGPLSAAAGRVAYDGDLTSGAALLERSVRAERRERDDDLRALERRRVREGASEVQAACAAFLERHPFAELDDSSGRRQIVRLLEIWPADPARSWARDRRGRVVAFFLDGRAGDVPPATLLRTAEALTGVPAETRARILLRAGERSAAEELARGINAYVSPEWIPFLLELAADRAARGENSGAREVLARLPISIRDSCDALLVRRDVARSSGDAGDLATVGERLGALRAGRTSEAASTLSVCLDPRAGGRIEVAVGPGAPALYAYGWNGGRSGFAVAGEGASRIPVATEGLSGQKTLRVAAFAGGSARELRALVGGPS